MSTLTASPEKNRGSEALLSRFEAAVLQQGEPAWIQAVRKAGNAHFGELGFPTLRDEEWQFTNVAPIANLPFHPAEPGTVTSEDLRSFTFGDMPARRLVFVNGFFQAELSSPISEAGGLQATALSEAIKGGGALLQRHFARYARFDDNAFLALNTAFFQDGAYIAVPAGKIVTEPIHVIYLTSGLRPGSAVFPRTLIFAGEHSQAKVVESYGSLNKVESLTNPVTEIVLEESAVLEHCKIQAESLNTFHVAGISTYQRRASNLLTHSISTGAALARNNITSVLDAEGIECTLNGLYLTRDTQLVDHHTAIHHAKAHCNSHEYYHGILDGKSQGVFNGKIFVRPDAQKTDAKQTNRNLLLSDDATMNTKPQLEIYADDVKCTHGATIGQMDEDAIFYLRARGIGLERARRMLVHAFASDIVNRISIEEVRDELDRGLFELYEQE